MLRNSEAARLKRLRADRANQVLPSLPDLRSNGVYTQAHELADAGYAVLPAAQSKAPLTRRGVKDATRDHEQIDAWAYRHPDANLGVACGEASGWLVVADIDKPDLARVNGKSRRPLTPIVRTGRGEHLWCTSTRAFKTVKTAWGELRGEGSYVVAPPSRHLSGKSYEWAVPLGYEQPLQVEALASFLPGIEDALESAYSAALSTHRPYLVPTEVPTRYQGSELGFLEGFDADEEAVAAMCSVLAIPFWDGRPFKCILHEEEHPSATVFPVDDGTFHYHDWHEQPEWLCFAQVRAKLAGRHGPLSKSELATWKLVLLAEAGILPAQVVGDSPPSTASREARAVYDGLCFVLGCRWNYTYGDPLPFSRRFGTAACRMSARDFSVAFRELERIGAIRRVGSVGQGRQETPLWLPAGVELGA